MADDGDAMALVVADLRDPVLHLLRLEGVEHRRLSNSSCVIRSRRGVPPSVHDDGDVPGHLTGRLNLREESIQAILDGLAWLGLESDEMPVFQSKRVERHAEVAQILLDRGAAYRCYCTPDELAAKKARLMSTCTFSCFALGE